MQVPSFAMSILKFHISNWLHVFIWLFILRVRILNLYFIFFVSQKCFFRSQCIFESFRIPPQILLTRFNTYFMSMKIIILMAQNCNEGLYLHHSNIRFLLTLFSVCQKRQLKVIALETLVIIIKAIKRITITFCTLFLTLEKYLKAHLVDFLISAATF